MEAGTSRGVSVTNSDSKMNGFKLECEICLLNFSTKKRSRQPYVGGKCGHSFCGSCSSKLKKTSKCPHCRAPFSPVKNFSLIDCLENMAEMKRQLREEKKKMNAKLKRAGVKAKFETVEESEDEVEDAEDERIARDLEVVNDRNEDVERPRGNGIRNGFAPRPQNVLRDLLVDFENRHIPHNQQMHYQPPPGHGHGPLEVQQFAPRRENVLRNLLIEDFVNHHIPHNQQMQYQPPPGQGHGPLGVRQEFERNQQRNQPAYDVIPHPAIVGLGLPFFQHHHPQPAMMPLNHPYQPRIAQNHQNPLIAERPRAQGFNLAPQRPASPDIIVIDHIVNRPEPPRLNQAPVAQINNPVQLNLVPQYPQQNPRVVVGQEFINEYHFNYI